MLKERQDVGRSAETVQALEAQMEELNRQFEAEAGGAAGGDPVADPLEVLAVRPKKAHVAVSACALAWAPFWQAPGAEPVPAWS